MRRWPNVANDRIGRGRNIDVEPTAQHRLNVDRTLAQHRLNVDSALALSVDPTLAQRQFNVGPYSWLNVGPTLVECHICDIGPTLAHRQE